MFTAVNDITKDMTQPVVAGFKADDLYQVVGGVLRSGDRINIYQVNENANKGDTSQSLANTDDNWTDASSDTAASLVWGNVFVQEVFDSAGAVISTSDSTTPAQRVNIYMDNDNVAAFYAALAQVITSTSLRCSKSTTGVRYPDFVRLLVSLLMVLI